VKALNNYLSAVALAATAEAMLAGGKFGIDPAVMLRF
jgi:3-hydroxyisobutyrate dehydrogenase